MIAALLLAAATPQTAVDAERAFAAAALRDGQWTAFRRYAADAAVMFKPEPVDARTFLKPLADPAVALRWSPAESYVSCDGRMAVNTGPWTRPGGASGYFTTVWQRQPGGWKWLMDGGDILKTPMPAVARPKVRRAACRGRPDRLNDTPDPGAARQGDGASGDGTLSWRWTIGPDGARGFDAYLWNGREMVQVVEDRIAPPPVAR